MGKIGLHLFSIQDLTEKNFLDTIKNIGKIGYDGVEFAEFYSLSAKEIKKVLDASGLTSCGSRPKIASLVEDLKNIIDFNLELNSPYIICPWLPKEMRDSTDSLKNTAELFNNIGLVCKENNIQFGFHTHSMIFYKFNGEYGFDILAKNTQADLVCLQIDTFWVEYLGLKIIDFMKKYPNRFPVLHIKDMNNFEEKKSTEIGNGIIDFKEIINFGKQNGTRWYIVEQEDFLIPYYNSFKKSIKYLKKIIN
jgi:sugar phosphate isomerase/epimerase